VAEPTTFYLREGWWRKGGGLIDPNGVPGALGA
jgi:hypothetical protein